METTTARPIHPQPLTAPDNGHVSTYPCPQLDDGGPVAHAIAVSICLLGVFAACMLAGWAMLRVADALGLLS